MNIQRDALVLAADGEIGRVKHVIVDHQTREVTDIVAGHDGRETIIPMSAVASVEGDRVTLRGNRSDLADGVRFDMDHYHPVDPDTVREETAGTAQRGGAPLIDAADDAVEIAGKPQAAPAGRRGVEQSYRLQLREEQLHAVKEREPAGQVRLGKMVTAHQETMNVPVTEERVVIERTPVADGTTAPPKDQGRR
jgi:hypothetical protein